MSDGEKWTLYSQALQKYLNHTKISTRKNDANILPVNNNESNRFPVEESFNFSLGNISGRPSLEMSGIMPLRDSLDSISQPAVRNFFEQARVANASVSEPENNVSMATARPPTRKRKATSRRHQPYRTNKRRAESSLSADMSRMRPCKVALNRLNWEPTNAR